MLSIRPLLAITAFASCTHVRQVQSLRPSSDDRAVTTSYGIRIPARASGEGWLTSTGQIVMPDQLQSTERVSHVRGAFEGLGLGALAGGLGGVVAGGIIGGIREDNCNDRPGFTICIEDAGLDALILGVLGTAAGGVVGAVIGGVRGSKLVNLRALPRLRVAPTPGGANAQLTWQL